jgi:hypothetical protein
MRLGARLFRLSRSRTVVAFSLLAGVFGTVAALYHVSLMPPGLHKRGLAIGAASTEILVASPNLSVGGTSYQYNSAINQGTLLGNVMVSEPVLSQVAKAMGVPMARIQASAPMTANVPRQFVQPGSGATATAILKSPEQYKLEIQADPSVPILHVYTQAPSAALAIKMATVAVHAVQNYVEELEVRQNVPKSNLVATQQLGPVKGGVANPGASKQIAILAFFGCFGVSLWLLTIFQRIRCGWLAERSADLRIAEAKLAEQPL